MAKRRAFSRTHRHVIDVACVVSARPRARVDELEPPPVPRLSRALGRARRREAHVSRASSPTSSTFDWTPDDPRAMRLAEPNAEAPLRVAVLLSGGVDSSVALSLLRAAGHECVAFYLQIWFQEDFRNTWDQCPWEEDLGVAQAVCERVGVPLETVPLTR